MEDQGHPQERAADPLGRACAWIEDEGLLRDEGVVFGLMRNAGALREKEAAIRAFHRRGMAEEARGRRAVQAELDALLRRQARDGSAGPPESTAPVVPAAGPGAAAVDGETHAPGGLAARYALGLAAAAVACAGTAAIVHGQMRPHVQHPALVTAGIVAVGCFTASLPVSLLFAGDEARRASGVEPWKARLAELGVPLVAALFVVAWAWESLGAPRAAATGALLFAAFAFAGRQVLSSVPRLGSALRALRQARDLRLGRGLEPERRVVEDAAAALRRRLAGFRSDEEWEAVCETRLAIFRSEYELAAARAGQPAPARPAPSSLFSTTESH